MSETDTNAHDQRYMARALALAEQALYVPTPNPRVGCVIVKDGQVIGQGATQVAGEAHAEVMALRDAARKVKDVQGATVYVTLEPCSHHGKTPPCTDALVQAKPSRVVIAHVDPNPAVAGQGIRALRMAGIAVTVGTLAHDALALNPGFVSRMIRGVPYVWLKIAASMDRFTALPDGQSQWITGAEARADGHHWRARSCLVLTGLGTVMADDPQMNVREVKTERQPQRAVIDARLEIDPQAKLLQTPGLLIFTANPPRDRIEEITRLGAKVVELPLREDSGRVDLHAVMRWLADHDVNEVHVEAGAGLNGALWQAGCADELLIYLAPMFLGDGKPMLDLPGIDQLSEADELTFIDQDKIGADIRLRARRNDRWQSLADHIDLENQRAQQADISTLDQQGQQQ